MMRRFPIIDRTRGDRTKEKIHASKLLAGLVPAGKLTSDPEVELVTTDSREVKPGCIFVAFPGERFDGHDFAARALEQGAEYVVVNHPVPGVPEEKAILCPDSYHAMMVMGANYRSQYHPKMVGVTGSVGKTTTKQYPHAGSKVPYGTTIYLYTDTYEGSHTEVPDVTGKSPDFARQMLSAAGLNCVVEGSGTVQAQSAEPGSSVQRGTIITLTCG